MAEIDGTVVGFVDVTISRPGADVDIHRPDVRGWVQEIAVAEDLRGHGIGAVLLAAAEAWARDRGAVWILLETHPANVEALPSSIKPRMGYAPSACASPNACSSGARAGGPTPFNGISTVLRGRPVRMALNNAS